MVINIFSVSLQTQEFENIFDIFHILGTHIVSTSDRGSLLKLTPESFWQNPLVKVNWSVIATGSLAV